MNFYIKINKITSIALLYLLTLTALSGCKKEATQVVDSSQPHEVKDRSEINPAVVNGMLHFDSFAELSSFTVSLQKGESDVEQVRKAYIKLGIDVNAETIPNLTDYPICLLKEQETGGYTSARKVEEDVINAALNQGDDNINSIVSSPFWKTALNANNSVHIGRRIYKYYDNGGIAIVLNDDWTLYESIQNLPYEALQESFNLIVTSDAREGWDQYFTFNTDGSIQSEKNIFIPRFMADLTPDGKRMIRNVSLIERATGGSAFKWIYADNSSSTDASPTTAIGPNQSIGVIIDNGSGTNVTLTDIESILACSVENFTITYLANNQVRFELPGYNPVTSQYNLRWLFSFSASSTSNPVIKTVTSNGTVTCQWFRKTDNTLACQFTKNVVINCGSKKTKEDSRQFTVTQCNPDQKWKLDGSIWVQAGEVGCRVKYLKRVLGVWVAAYNQGACADLSGTYIRE